MSNIFGSCKDKHATWVEGENEVVFSSNVDGQEDVTLCTKPVKNLRPNEDGSWTVIFADDTEGETIEFSQNGEPQLSVVDADGNTTYVDAEGETQTVPATDVNGDPIDPSQAVWNFIDGEGNYLGSKPCKDQTVLAQTPNAVLLPVSEGNTQTITQCCTWTQVVDEDGNVTYPEGHPLAGENVPAVDAEGNLYPAGTTVQSQTDANGIYADSHKVVPKSIVDVRCVDGSTQYTYCDGSTACTGSIHREEELPFTDGSLAVIEVDQEPGEIFRRTINLEPIKTGSTFKIRAVHTKVFERGADGSFPDTAQQGVNVRFWWSVDGGTTKNFTDTGRSDQAMLQLTNAADGLISTIGEFEFTNLDITEKYLIPTELTVGWDLIENTLQSGQADVNASNVYFSWIEDCCRHFDAEGNETDADGNLLENA